MKLRLPSRVGLCANSDANSTPASMSGRLSAATSRQLVTLRGRGSASPGRKTYSKPPNVLEFLGIEEKARYSESPACF